MFTLRMASAGLSAPASGTASIGPGSGDDGWIAATFDLALSN